jgi:electron transport complex protein RnfG
MVVVLTVLSAASGGLLAAVRSGTMERIEKQELEFVKGPAIKSILEGVSNDPIADRFKISDQEIERNFFVGISEGKANIFAFETSGKGYGGPVGLMVGVNITDDKVIGVGVTTHKETPGVGSRAKTEPEFAAQFKGLSVLDYPFKVKADGGQVDALSGATYTSKGVAEALTRAGDIYKRLKPQLAEKLKEYSK